MTQIVGLRKKITPDDRAISKILPTRISIILISNLNYHQTVFSANNGREMINLLWTETLQASNQKEINPVAISKRLEVQNSKLLIGKRFCENWGQSNLKLLRPCRCRIETWVQIWVSPCGIKLSLSLFAPYPDPDGGILFNQAAHHIDICICWLFETSIR